MKNQLTVMAQNQEGYHVQNHPNLSRFVVKGRATGKQLGTGSYGSVEEVVVNGLVCAGKRIHEVLLDTDNAGMENVVDRYVQECQLMSDLRHPNIAMFLGLCFFTNCQLPVLVMERLNGSLDDLLETVSDIPLVLKRSILEDVSRGLLYLHKHTPQIIHRDLTAKNVLLTSSLVAKVTDFGNSRIVTLQPGQLARTLSRLPGTLVYMPPEALSSSSRYGPSLDVFSFGHLALFTFTQVFPGNLLEPNYPNPNNPRKLVGRSEVERRGEYFDKLERKLSDSAGYPLVKMVRECLDNIPSERPNFDEIVVALESVRGNIEGPYGAVVKIDAVKQVVMLKSLGEREGELREKEREIQRLQSQIEQTQERYELELHVKEEQLSEVQKQLQHAQEEMMAAQVAAEIELSNMTQVKDSQLRKKDYELQRKENEIQKMEDQLLQKNSELQQKGLLLSELQQQVTKLQSEKNALEEMGQQKDQLLQLKEAELLRNVQLKDTEVQKQDIQLAEIHQELIQVQAEYARLKETGKQKDRTLGRKRTEMLQKDAQIARNQEELHKLQELLQQKDSQLVSALQQSITSIQTLLKELEIPLRVKWRTSNNLPNVMGSYPQAVVVKGKVYIGGAELLGRGGTVMVFNPLSEQWTTLPPYEYACFGMAVANNQLVLVGGVNVQTEQKTNRLGVWNEQFRQWMHPYPSMQVARQSPEVVTHDDRWLVVVGDFGDRINNESKVEILDVSTFQGKWFTGQPITQPLHKVTSVIVGNIFILCGGVMRRGAAIQVCLDNLISQATASHGQAVSVSRVNAQLPTPSPWQTLPRAPMEGSTALALNGALLAVGGLGSNAIHLYQPSSRKWTKAGELPTERVACVCVVLPDGRVLVTGGDVNKKRVDIACFELL